MAGNKCGGGGPVTIRPTCRIWAINVGFLSNNGPTGFLPNFKSANFLHLPCFCYHARAVRILTASLLFLWRSLILIFCFLFPSSSKYPLILYLFVYVSFPLAFIFILFYVMFNFLKEHFLLYAICMLEYMNRLRGV